MHACTHSHQAEEKFYAPLLLFGEELRDGEVQEGEIQLQIGEQQQRFGRF